MSTKPISDLIHFFGIEESNLLGNIANLGFATVQFYKNK